MNQQSKSADGVRGHLLNLFNGEYVFRVYDEKFKFVDYDITHHDLEVMIIGDDASLYSSEFGDYIDYKPINEIE